MFSLRKKRDNVSAIAPRCRGSGSLSVIGRSETSSFAIPGISVVCDNGREAGYSSNVANKKTVQVHGAGYTR